MFFTPYPEVGDLRKICANFQKYEYSHIFNVVLILWALFGAVVDAQAQALAETTAQESILQLEREKALREQMERVPDERLPRPIPERLLRIPEAESPCFTIYAIRLTGDAAEQFLWALDAANLPDDPVVGRCLGANGINLVMKRVQDAIVASGFVTTRILASPQDLKSGVLNLTLIPGRISAIRIADNTAWRANKWNAMPAQPGDILNLRDIEQALENFKRIPTAEADIQIEPGRLPGESDLVIRWKQDFPFRLNLFADDAGNKATGKYQGGITMSYDNWWTLNDLFYVSNNHSLDEGGDSTRKGTKGYTIHYSLPYGYWLLGLTASEHNYYQAVAGANQTYIYSGENQNSEIKLSRLVYRDAVRKTTLSIRGWQRASKNFIDDTEVEVQRRHMGGWALGVAHREFIGESTLDMNLAYRKGTGAFDSIPAPEEAFGEGTSRPRLVTAEAQYNHPILIGQQRLRYSGVFRAQWNDTPLVPQDRFSIGSRYTVRGFDGENVLSAERGWLIRNDLGIGLGDSGQELYLGIDYGEVAGPSSPYLLGRRLSGGVIGVRGAIKKLGYDIFVGQPFMKPEGFKTADATVGFSLNLAF